MPVTQWSPLPGHRTLLITGAIDLVVEPLRPLFDDIVCARLAERDGRIVGELVEPPPSFGWLALGWSGLTTTFDTPSGEQRSRTDAIHGALVYSYGLPTSERFQPRMPFDHFDFRAEASVASDTSYSTLRMRALLYGRAFGGPRLRGAWGAFGSYDFDSPERIRVSALGLGLGVVVVALEVADDGPPHQLAEAVRTIAGGESLLAPAVTKRLIERYVSRLPGDTARRERFAELTERELEVLQLITRGRSNAEIGTRLFLSEATVKTHVTRILTKLGVRDRVQAVVLAYQTGLFENR